MKVNLSTKFKNKKELSSKQLCTYKIAKAIILLVFVGLLELLIDWIFQASGLPETATEADRLTQGEIYLGFFLSLFQVVLKIISIILPYIVWPYIMYQAYILFKKN